MDSNLQVFAKPRSAYVHVPFCSRRCGYCDFTLIADRDDLISEYLVALEREIESERKNWDREQNQQAATSRADGLETLFLGGGTPTHPSCEQLQKLFQIIHQRFQILPGAEVSVEANPLDLTQEKIGLLADSGVNRISLGVQSFSPQSLRLLERDHSPDDIDDVMLRLRERFENISIDLIFGVPGQSLDGWKSSLRRAIGLGVTHMSIYGLTWEPGTSFWTRRKRGEMQPIDEGLERDQYALAIEYLCDGGLEHYEISNFARPGFHCRHNEAYWIGDSYWAYGPGAARYVNGSRETNIRSVLGWLKRIKTGESPVAETETLEPVHRAKELLFLGLRRIQGISRAEFQRRCGFPMDQIAQTAIRENVARGWLDDDHAGIRLTREGLFMADRVAADFL